MRHEVRHFSGDLIITGPQVDQSELISPSVLSVFTYYPFVTSVIPDNGKCQFVGLGSTSSLRLIWTCLRINRVWEETATHQPQLFSKDNVWHIHNTPSSSSCIWHFFCLRFWPHRPVIGRASGSPSGRKWRGQRRPALQPWVNRHVQMKVWGWCWWVTLTHYSSKTFCSFTSAILGSAPHPQNKDPESRSQPELLCQFLFLLSVRLSFQQFSPDLILSHRRGFPLVNRVGDDVIP